MAVAIIGTGWGARVQVPAFRSAGLPVVALAGSDAAKTAQIARDLDVAVGLGDWRAALARDDVRLVSIVTPPDLHSEMALAALAAGKHVLCEKPTALDRDQARRMLDAAVARPDQLALIDHELRFLPALAHARELIASGAIGHVRLAVSHVLASARADPQRPWNWWSDAARGGGVLGAIGSHQIDTLRYLLGAEVAAVAATLHTFVGQRPDAGGARPVTSDDYHSLRLRFSDGALASAEASMVVRLDEPNSLTIYGDEGTLRWAGGRLLHAPAGQQLSDITPADSQSIPAGLEGDFPHATVYLAHALRRFLEGDRAAVAPAASFADGLRIQSVLDAARRSHASGGGYVELD